MVGFIYKTTCLVNNKIYIGKHEGSEDDGYIGSGEAFSHAVRKYGKKNFKREILRRCETLHELRIWEHVYIKKYHAQDKGVGYNIADGDVNTTEYNPTRRPEVIEKMMKKNRQTTRDPEYRRKHSEIMKEYYKTHPATFTGKHHSEETKRKIAEKHKGKPSPQKGIPLSEETKAILSAKMKGRFVGEKNANYGHRWNEEQRKHLSDVKRGLKPSKGK